MAGVRLIKLMRQFNVGISDIVEFLKSEGIDVNESINAKVDESVLPLLESRFNKEREIKADSEKKITEINELVEKVGSEQGLSVKIQESSSDVSADTHDNLSFAHILSEDLEGEIVEGIVTEINEGEVVVRVGNKYDGYIKPREFRYNPDLKLGDKVEVYVEVLGDKKRLSRFSHRRARRIKSWERINEAFKKDDTVKGFIKTCTEGGLIADVFGAKVFLPETQIDINPVEDLSSFVNRTIDLKIVYIDQKQRDVVASHKILLLEQEYERAKEDCRVRLSEYVDFLSSINDCTEVPDGFIPIDYEDEKASKEYECPDKSRMKHTHGSLICPYCRKRGASTCTDGTAQCGYCHKWFAYA